MTNRFELQVEGSDGPEWVDVTGRVRNDPQVVRGVPEEASVADPGSCVLELDNRDGFLSPRNPRSPWFGGFGVGSLLRAASGVDGVGPSVRDTVAQHVGSPYTATVTLPAYEPDDALLLLVCGGGTGAFGGVPRVLDDMWPLLTRGPRFQWPTYLRQDASAQIRAFWVSRAAILDGATTADVAGASAVVCLSIRDVAGFRPILAGTNGLSAEGLGVYMSAALRTANTAASVAPDTGTWADLTGWQEEVNLDSTGSTYVANGSFVASVVSVPRDSSGVDQPIGSWVRSGSASNGPSASLVVSFQRQDDGARRFVGFVDSWPSTWQPAGTDSTASVTARGILSRMSVEPARSAVAQAMRTIVDSPNVDTLGYWSLETDLVGLKRPARARDVSFGSDFRAAGGVGALNSWDGVLTLPLDRSNDDGSSSRYGAYLAFRVPREHPTGVVLRMDWATVGGSFRVVFTVTATEVECVVTIRDGEGVVISTSSTLSAPRTDETYRMDLEFLRGINDADVFVFFGGQFVLTSATGLSVYSGGPRMGPNITLRSTVANVPISHFWAIRRILNPDTGQLLNVTNEVNGFLRSLLGHPDETATERIHRVAIEAGIVPAVTDDKHPNDVILGPQPFGNALDIMRDAAETDGGLLSELPGSTAITYRPRTDLYWPNSRHIVYGDGVFVGTGLQPVEDDRTIINELSVVDVNTQEGVTARVREGRLGTQDPPKGVGVRSRNDEVSVSNPVRLPSLLSWRLFLGQQDEPHYRSIPFSIRRLRELNVPEGDELADWLETAQLGDQLTITNPPDWFPPGPINLTLDHLTETLGMTDRVFVFKARTAVPYQPGIVGGEGRGLVLPGANGDFAWAPDDASLDITGDMSVRVLAELDSWRAQQNLAGKYETSGDQRGWFFRVQPSGHLALFWSTNGLGATVVSRESTATVPATGKFAVRIDLDVDNGAGGHTVTFYTAPGLDGPWTQLGAPVVTAGTTSVFAGSMRLTAGAILDAGTGNPATGAISAMDLFDGATLVANPRFNQQPSSTTTFTDDAGNNWTVAGNAEIEQAGATDVKLQRVDSLGSTLNTSITDSATSFDVDVDLTERGTALWTTNPDNWNPNLNGGGLFIRIGGEVMQVTNITGSSSPQTFTVIRGIEGFTKAHDAGESIRVANPSRIGL